MTRFFASALALTLATGGAHAAAHKPAENMATDAQTTAGAATTEMAETDMNAMRGDLIRSRDITGGTIYTMNEADNEGWNNTRSYDAVGENWNDIGEIEDLILSKDGKIIGIAAEIGGFLDIADKHVMIPVQNLRLVAVDDKTYAFVTRHSEEELEQLEDIDEGFWD